MWYPAAENAVETQQVIGPPDAPLLLAGKAAEHAAMAPALEKWPLIVLSHGTGGSAMQMAWLGTALARAGYHCGGGESSGQQCAGAVYGGGLRAVVGARDGPERGAGRHAGGSGVWTEDRCGSRVGAAGFSIGGYTVLALGGARTDISVIVDLCKQQPDTPVCHVPEMKDMGTPEQMLAAVRKTSGVSLARSNESYQRSTRACDLCDCAGGGDDADAATVCIRCDVPVQIVVGSADPIATPKDNADYIRAHIRGAKETVLPNVAHYTFLDTCTAAGKQKLGVFCEDPAGVDREAVHTAGG